MTINIKNKGRRDIKVNGESFVLAAPPGKKGRPEKEGDEAADATKKNDHPLVKAGVDLKGAVGDCSGFDRK
jgi:hypothetical protein